MAKASKADVAAEIREAKADLSTEKEKLVALKTQIEPFNRISYYLSQIFKPNPNLAEHSKAVDTPTADFEHAAPSSIMQQQNKDRSTITPVKKKHRSEPSL